MSGYRYNWCAVYGHSWDELGLAKRGEVWHYRIQLRCEHCGTIRIDCVDAFGNVQARQYHHPDDYHYAQDDRPSRAEFRLMMYKRKKAYDPSEDTTSSKNPHDAASA